MDKLLTGSSNVKHKASEADKGQQKKSVLRKYDSSYLELGFTSNESLDHPRPKCDICHEELANESMKPAKLRRHLETKHSELKDKPLAYFQKKEEELQALRKEMRKFSSTTENAMYASYLITLQIAKAGAAHTVGETLVMPAMIEAVRVMLGEKNATEVGKIPLSNDTVARRISEMSQWMEDQLIQRIASSPFFALQFDDSTDVQGLSAPYFCAVCME